MNRDLLRPKSLGAMLLCTFPIVGLFNSYAVIELAGDYSFRPLDCLYLASVVLAFVGIALNRRIPILTVSAVSMICVFIGAASLSVLYTNTVDSLDIGKTGRLIQTFSWGALASYFFSDRRAFIALLRNLLVSGLIAGSVALYVLFTVPGIHRVGAFYGWAGGEGLQRQASYNEVAAMMSLVLTLSLYCLIYARVRLFGRSVMLLAAAMAAIALVLTQSRSGAVAFLATILFLVFLRFSGLIYRFSIEKNDLRVLGAWALLIVAAAVFLQSAANIDRYSGTFTPGTGAYESVFVRLAVWQEGWEIIKEQPGGLLFGFGKGAIPDLLGAPTLENFFFDTTFAYGALGLVTVLAFLLVPVSYGRPSQPRISSDYAYYIGLLTFVVALTVGMTGNVVADPMFGGLVFLLLYGSSSTQRFAGNGQ